MGQGIKMAIRYHGGKWMLAPWIIEHFPPHRVYVEPFGGGASVLLRKSPAYAEIYSDLNDEVVSFFKVLRDNPEALKNSVRLTPFSETEFKRSYSPADSDLENARRLLCRSFMGRGSDSVGRLSGFRMDSNRSGSTPAHDWSRWPDRVDALAQRLNKVTIMCRPANDVMEKFDRKDTLHFVDPPYLAKTRKSVGAYACEMASETEHEDMIDVLNSLDGMVVLCGYQSDIYDQLLSGWKVFTKSAFADGARERTECLWLNPAAAEKLNEKKNQIEMFTPEVSA